MSKKIFVLKDETRKRCTIKPLSEVALANYRPLAMELFDYLYEVDRIDFCIYFCVGQDFIEFIKPNETSKDLLSALKTAMTKNYDNINVYIRVEDVSKFHEILKIVRTRKINAIIEKDPLLDRKTLVVYGDLSNASQMVVRGGVTAEAAAKISTSTAKMVDFLMENKVAIGTLSRMVACDPTLYDHSASVAMIASMIATKLVKQKFTKKYVDTIAQCGLYHDMGKTCVPSHVLNKPGKFTAEEYEIMKSHTILGHQEIKMSMASGAPIDELVARVALEHHERFHGQGYPNCKKGRFEDDPGQGIHIATRIVTIADVYSALLMKRVYKPAYDATEAIKIMAENAAEEYDPEIFIPFLKNITESLNYFAKADKNGGRILVMENGKLKLG